MILLVPKLKIRNKFIRVKSISQFTHLYVRAIIDTHAHTRIQSISFYRRIVIFRARFFLRQYNCINMFCFFGTFVTHHSKLNLLRTFQFRCFRLIVFFFHLHRQIFKQVCCLSKYSKVRTNIFYFICCARNEEQS